VGMISIQKVLLEEIEDSADFLRLSHVVGRLKGADVGRDMGASSL
jgi:hypothetical protein